MKGAAAVLAALLAFAPLADGNQRFQYRPPEERLRAAPDSPFIQGVLREPFTSFHDENQVRIRILQESGNAEEAQLLENAEQRRRLAMMTGEPYQRPATIGEAISAERSLGSFVEPALKAFERVTIEYSKDALDAKHREATVRNDLALPVKRLWFRIGETTYSCPADDDEPGSRIHGFEPGSARTAKCHTNDSAGLVEAPVPVHPYSVTTEAGSLDSGHNSANFSTERSEGRQQAWSRLVDAPCAQKGTCAHIEQGERKQLDEKVRRDRPMIAVLVLGFAALLAAAYAAARVRSREPAGIFRSLCSAAVILYAGIVLAALYAGLRPDHGNLDLLPFAVIYIGGLPFLGLLAIAGTGAREHPLHAFATTLGVGLIVVVGSLFVIG